MYKEHTVPRYLGCGHASNGSPGFWCAASMTHPRLPAELLDHTIDHLHDARDALKNCCLASKSWIPRTRKHLFAHVKFLDPQDLYTWKATFPDPSTSPARYTKILVVWCAGEYTAADAEDRGWILAFSRVVHFGVDFFGPNTSLLSFHGFSPALKSLRLTYINFPFSQVLNLIHSFPLIEELYLTAWNNDSIEDSDGRPTPVQPPLIGTLELSAEEGMATIVPRLFPLQNSLHFWELDLELIRESDILVISELVERCRFTLESLKVSAGRCGTPVLPARSYQWLIL